MTDTTPLVKERALRRALRLADADVEATSRKRGDMTETAKRVPSSPVIRLGIRVIVCGGRDYTDCVTIRRTLFDLHNGPRGPIRHLFHGNAAGADSEADRWASEFPELGVRVHPCPAGWSKHGKAAGPIRNKNMLGQSPDLVVAFPGGRGTRNMVKQARAAGVEVMEIGNV